MNDDLLKQQRLKAAEQYYKDVYESFNNLAKSFKAALGKDKSGLRISQNPNGITPEPAKTGLRIFQAGAVKEMAKGAIDHLTEKVAEVGTQAKDAIADKVEVQARNFTREREQYRANGQTAEQAFAAAIAPEPVATKKPDEKEVALPAPDPEPATPATSTEVKEPEAAKVKDRLLYADNQLKSEMQMTDMLAVASLFTAQKGDRLSGDSAKNLVVEFNGELLLKTDREGKVQVNNLENQEVLSKFDVRERLQIADSVAQFEALKPQIQQAIQMQKPADIPQLTAEMEQRVKQTNAAIQKTAANTPEVLPAQDPEAQETHQEIGSKRTEAASVRSRTVTRGSVEYQVEAASVRPQEQPEWAKLEPLSPALQQTSPQAAQVSTEQAKTQLRLVNLAAVVFHSNYKGEIPAQGSITAPDGTVIHKTITDREAKAFDLEIEKDGQKHQVASYRAGAWAMQPGIDAAMPALRNISSQVGVKGEFIEPEVKVQQPLALSTQGQSQTTEPERDYER